jgi:dTMP kinase
MRVRKGFRDLAERNSERYLVIDALLPADEIARRVQRRVSVLVPSLATPGPEQPATERPREPVGER